MIRSRVSRDRRRRSAMLAKLDLRRVQTEVKVNTAVTDAAPE
jgi:hypothetical protein